MKLKGNSLTFSNARNSKRAQYVKCHSHPRYVYVHVSLMKTVLLLPLSTQMVERIYMLLEIFWPKINRYRVNCSAANQSVANRSKSMIELTN